MLEMRKREIIAKVELKRSQGYEYNINMQKLRKGWG